MWYIEAQKDCGIHYLVSDSVIKVTVLTKKQLLPQDISVKSQYFMPALDFYPLGHSLFM